MIGPVADKFGSQVQAGLMWIVAPAPREPMSAASEASQS